MYIYHKILYVLLHTQRSLVKGDGLSLAAHLSHEQNLMYGVREHTHSLLRLIPFNIPKLYSEAGTMSCETLFTSLNGHPWPYRPIGTGSVPRSLTAFAVEPAWLWDQRMGTVVIMHNHHPITQPSPVISWLWGPKSAGFWTVGFRRQGSSIHE